MANTDTMRDLIIAELNYSWEWNADFILYVLGNQAHHYPSWGEKQKIVFQRVNDNPLIYDEYLNGLTNEELLEVFMSKKQDEWIDREDDYYD